MYGTQTMDIFLEFTLLFENDVKMYGTQTMDIFLEFTLLFENDVKMYGTQTWIFLVSSFAGLRMM